MFASSHVTDHARIGVHRAEEYHQQYLAKRGIKSLPHLNSMEPGARGTCALTYFPIQLERRGVHAVAHAGGLGPSGNVAEVSIATAAKDLGTAHAEFVVEFFFDVSLS